APPGGGQAPTTQAKASQSTPTARCRPRACSRRSPPAAEPKLLASIGPIPPRYAELAIYALYAYTGLVTATFDPKKDAANLKKHGVSLTEGDGVLRDPLAVTIEDDAAEGEKRFVTLGANTFGSLMVVVWTP